MENHTGDVTIVPEVDELVGTVTEVGVERDERAFEAGDDRFEILRRVVQILRHLVLTLQAVLDQEGRQGRGTRVQRLPRDMPRPLHERDGVGNFLRNHAEDTRKIPSCHGRIPRRSTTGREAGIVSVHAVTIISQHYC